MTDRRGWTFTAVGFAVALVAVGIGAAVGLAVVPVVGSYLGMLLGGVAAGLAVDERPLVETGLAAVLATLGILTAGATIGSGPGAAVSALGAVAPTTLLISVVLSFAVGAFGAHFGDDIRDGMTEPVERTPTKSVDTGLSGVAPADDETVRDEQQVRSDTDSDTSTPAEGEQEESTSMELEYE